MNLKVTVSTILGLLAAAALVFFAFERELAGAWFTFGVHPEVTGLLERSLDDQKRLARGDPAHAPLYRRRFDATQVLLGRLRILELSRGEIVWRYEAVLLGLFAGVLTLGSTIYAVRQARQEARLVRLQGALAELAAGGTDVRAGDHRERQGRRRRDVIGRIGAMVEETSRVIARDRRRLASLENLSAWQEAARRQAHEMRTPLTAARLELSRLRDLASPELSEITESAFAEIDRLGRLTQAFTAFARLPEPALVRRDLGPFLAEYVETFAAAWPSLALRLVPPGQPYAAVFDPEMVRQVLVNLCDNSALALGERSGSVTVSLGACGEWTSCEVADDGPGVAPAIRPRLFEPYATTRKLGEGMGLGLAISRKILLDHGGDLELARSGETGAVFRLLFPRVFPPAGEGP